MSLFRKATKAQAKARIALVGPSGSGKTYTALTVAKHLGDKIAVIDTEHGSASKYAGDVADFDTCELDNYEPSAFVAAIREAERAGYDVIVLDSLTHAWRGTLEIVDKAARKNKGNSFAGWRDATPEHNRLIDAIVGSRCHVIATMRAKTEWVVERDERTGKQSPRKIGLQPDQRSGAEFEFDLVGDMDDATLTVTKSRCAALHDTVIRHPGREFAEQIRDWLTDGVKPLHLELVESVSAVTDVEALRAWCLANKEKIGSLRNSSKEAAVNAMLDKGAALGLDEHGVKALFRVQRPQPEGPPDPDPNNGHETGGMSPDPSEWGGAA